MPAPTHKARWFALVVLIGAVAAAVVYALSADVVWTIVPLLMTVAAVRRVRRGGAARHRYAPRHVASSEPVTAGVSGSPVGW